MHDAQATTPAEEPRAAVPASSPARLPTRAGQLLPPLIAALLCTGLIVEGIAIALGARANGDILVIICPLLGIAFIAIPAAQAWWRCISILRGH